MREDPKHSASSHQPRSLAALKAFHCTWWCVSNWLLDLIREVARSERLVRSDNVGFPTNTRTRHTTCRTAAVATMAAVECAFPSLPLCCTLDIFARLTCWERLRARAVSPAWGTTLSNGLLWTDVDLSLLEHDGKASVSFLTAVGRVANGHITRLDFSGQMWRGEQVAGVSRRVLLLPELLAFLAVHAGTLRHLVLRNEDMSSEDARAFFLRKPGEVERVEMDVDCFYDEAQPLLCCEAPFETLRLRSLRISGRKNDDLYDFPNECALSLARDLPKCACLEKLALENAPLSVPPVWEALSAGFRKLTTLGTLYLWYCRLEPRSVPGLVLLLAEGCLDRLSIDNCSDDVDDVVEPLFDEPGGIAFGDALRANTKLTTLEIRSARLWDVPPAGLAIIDSIVGHASLTTLDLDDNKLSRRTGKSWATCLGG